MERITYLMDTCAADHDELFGDEVRAGNGRPAGGDAGADSLHALPPPPDELMERLKTMDLHGGSGRSGHHADEVIADPDSREQRFYAIKPPTG